MPIPNVSIPNILITVRDYTDDTDEIGLGYIGPSIQSIKDMLLKAGIRFVAGTNGYGINEYDGAMEQAVMEFQESQNIKKPLGVIDDNTLNKLLEVSGSSDIIYSEKEEDGYPEINVKGNPHYDSFFSKNSSKDAKKNNKDIVITLGKDAVTKIIRNVYMRGVSVEYDTSGNPISEIYEFIAQDLTESDEYYDNTKY